MMKKENPAYFLGVNVGGHDSSIAVVSTQDKKIQNIDILLSERQVKIKHQGGFPLKVLAQFKRDNSEIWKMILEDHVAINSFSKHPKEIESLLSPQDHDAIDLFGLKKASITYNSKVHFFSHHLCHAYSVLPQCPFSKAIIVVSDGAGSRGSHFTSPNPEEKFVLPEHHNQSEFFSIYLLNEGIVTPVDKRFMHLSPTMKDNISMGKGFGTMFEMASRLIFGDWTQAGKVMGLSAYGQGEEIKDPEKFILDLSQLPFQLTSGKDAFDHQDPEQFKLKADTAASVQDYFESKMIKELINLRKLYPDYENLILVGGCALNGLLNARILREKIFSRAFVPPFPNDEGISLGCAVALAMESNAVELKPIPFEELNPYLGNPQYDTEVNLNRVEVLFKDFHIKKSEDISKDVALLLQSGEIIAWMQGRSEVGPRALGNRSILVRPDIPGIKEKLNHHVKFREAFRPYGASVMYEHTSEFFEVDADYQSPFMTFCPQVRKEKLHLLGGVTHLDGTCRIQTLMKEQNPRFYALIFEFYKLTGLPVLLNTSLNIMGQPILETIEDSLLFFSNSTVKYLVYGPYLISKD